MGFWAQVWPPGWAREHAASLSQLHARVAELHALVIGVETELHHLHRTVASIATVEADEAAVLTAIAKALDAVDLPPGKVEAITTIVQANLVKLRRT
jgi:hypothetical protein